MKKNINLHNNIENHPIHYTLLFDWVVSVYGFLDTLLVNQAATFTASFWMARTADGVL
jgi:hypothetical protein